MIGIIIASVLCIIAILVFIMGICSFKEKGFLLNNAFLYAPKEERETMNKKPYYRQSAVIFLLIGFVFLLNALSLFFRVGWISFIAVAIIIITLVYAIVSSAAIDKKNKQQ